MSKKLKKKLHQTNGEIRVTEVRLIVEGTAPVVCTTSEALKISESMGLDLVIINENSTPPIAKVMNYEKYIYELGRKTKQKKLDVKEVKFSVNISDNDLSYRVKHIDEFLSKGHKVKLSLKFKGREMAYLDKGKEVLLKIAVAIEDKGSPETLPQLEGKQMFMLLRPRNK